MAFPVILNGPEGEQFSTYTTARWPLGTQLVVQDGRKFRFALAGGSTLVAGNLAQAAANTANNVGMTAFSASAVGARTQSWTLGGGTTAANEYAQGYNTIDDVNGEGYLYLVDSHPAVASGTTQAINFAAGHSIQVATTTSSVGSLIHNPFYKVIKTIVTTATQLVVGVSVKPVTNAQYGWIQTHGTASVLTAGTAVLAQNLISSATAGAAGPPSGTGAAIDVVIGVCMRVAATTDFSVVYLQLDG